MDGRACRAFTLLELLVVIAIISVLTALLLAVTSSVRFQANTLECASNLRQIATALTAYRWDNAGKFPPNHGGRGHFWYDQVRLGKYIPTTRRDLPEVRGRVMKCPLDDDDSIRSFAMNAWASSALDQFVINMNTRGAEQLWQKREREPTRMVLLADAFANRGTRVSGWYPNPTIGQPNIKPGQRFGAPPHISFGTPRGSYVCDLAYPRHAIQRRTNLGNKPIGRINIAYVDGHVELKAYEELVDVATNKSRLENLWTPIDCDLNR